MTDIDALVAKFLRYAEIQEATETRNMGREATNSWSEGFRQAATTLTALSDEIAVLKDQWDAANQMAWIVLDQMKEDDTIDTIDWQEMLRSALTDKADGESK